MAQMDISAMMDAFLQIEVWTFEQAKEIKNILSMSVQWGIIEDTQTVKKAIERATEVIDAHIKVERERDLLDRLSQTAERQREWANLNRDY